MAVGNHLNNPVPFFLAGGDPQRGFFKPGFYSFDDQPRTTRLLSSIVSCMGIEDKAPIGNLDDESSRGSLEQIERAKT